MERIYLDNAATTPIIDEVFEAMLPFLKTHYGNPSSIHAEGRTARAALEKSRRNIAKTIGAAPSEIFFTSGGTEANNTAIKCAVRDLGVKRIISSKLEHACVRNSVLSMQAMDVELVFVNTDAYGRADLNHLSELLKDQSKKTLVSLMHSNNEIGTLNDIEAIARLCETHQAYFHSDTVQTIGYFPIDLKKTPIHFVSGSGHKLYGPKGVGFLYINKNVHLSPLIDGGGQERQMRSGTENVASIVGLGKAVELAQKAMDTHRQHIDQLRAHFVQQLKENFGQIVSFNGDLEREYHYKVLNVNFDTPIASDMLLFKLDLAGISASGGSACSSGAMKGSAVLAALGVADHLRSVRFSFSHMNTIAEIDICIQKLKEILD
jgi:cysteine desulfurase